jgi:hypothetical protein
MRKMKQQKTKIRIEKDMNSFKERVSMKEETTTPKKLLSPKGAIEKIHNRPHNPANNKFREPSSLMQRCFLCQK